MCMGGVWVQNMRPPRSPSCAAGGWAGVLSPKNVLFGGSQRAETAQNGPKWAKKGLFEGKMGKMVKITVLYWAFPIWTPACMTRYLSYIRQQQNNRSPKNITQTYSNHGQRIPKNIISPISLTPELKVWFLDLGNIRTLLRHF